MLPTVTIAILQIALISRLVRREMVVNLASPYLTVARSRGVSERALTWRYAFANAALPVVTALGTRFAAMLNGVVIVEVVFNWPGVGELVVNALKQRDFPLIQATVLVTVRAGALRPAARRPALPAHGPAGPSRRGQRMTTSTNLPGHPQVPNLSEVPGSILGRDSAVNKVLLRRSAAARRARYSTIKIWVGAICAGVVIIPVVLARVLPLPDPIVGALSESSLPPFSAGPPPRHRPQRP